MKPTTAFTFAVLTILCGHAYAQDKPAEPKGEEKFFRLNLVVKELEQGKVINARNYSTIVCTGGKNFHSQSMRTGSKVPVSSGSGYTDVGISFDFNNPEIAGNNLTLGLVADVTSNAEEAVLGHPVIRQNRWSSPVIIPLRTPTIVFSSDDVSSRSKLQVEITATPIMP